MNAVDAGRFKQAQASDPSCSSTTDPEAARPVPRSPPTRFAVRPRMRIDEEPAVATHWSGADAIGTALDFFRHLRGRLRCPAFRRAIGRLPRISPPAHRGDLSCQE